MATCMYGVLSELDKLPLGLVRLPSGGRLSEGCEELSEVGGGGKR